MADLNLEKSKGKNLEYYGEFFWGGGELSGPNNIFKMPDGRTPRGGPSRETIPSPSMVCRYVRAYTDIYHRV